MNHTCLCLPSRSWYTFTDAGEWKAELALGYRVTSMRLLLVLLSGWYFVYVLLRKTLFESAV